MGKSFLPPLKEKLYLNYFVLLLPNIIDGNEERGEEISVVFAALLLCCPVILTLSFHRVYEH